MGKRGKKNLRRQRQKDWAPGFDENRDMEVSGENDPKRRGTGQKKKSHARKREKFTKGGKKAEIDFTIRKGILNTIGAAQIDDEDQVMTGDITAKAIGGGRSGKKRKNLINKLKQQRDFGHLVGSGWHLVRIVGGAKHDKIHLFNQLVTGLGVSLVPICLTVERNDWVFYVDNPEVATAVKSKNGSEFADSKGLSDNFQIKVAPSPAPKMEITPKVEEVVNRVIQGRFRAEHQSLDLNRFHEDQVFVNESLYVPLSRSSVMAKVMDTICSRFPELRALNFSDNKLPTLQHFFQLSEKCEGLKILYLNNNRLSDIKDLHQLGCLKICELNLAGNATLVKRFRSGQELSTAVQKIFPSLKVLDGQRLISFEDDQDEAFELPKIIKKNTIPDKESTIAEFVKQYFEAYDGNDRRVLAAAYHEEAFFSLTSFYPPGTSAHGSSRLTNYEDHSRNLRRVKKGAKRNRHLKSGREEIVSFINDDLPRSKHNFNSFTFDMPFATDNFVTFTISGTFHDRSERAVKPSESSVRHFSRTFNVIAYNGGLVIANEMLNVTVASPSQSKEHVSSFQQSISSNGSAGMIRELCLKTNLKHEWGEKCLAQTNWNLEAAIEAFSTAMKDGRIPQEYFN